MKDALQSSDGTYFLHFVPMRLIVERTALVNTRQKALFLVSVLVHDEPKLLDYIVQDDIVDSALAALSDTDPHFLIEKLLEFLLEVKALAIDFRKIVPESGWSKLDALRQRLLEESAADDIISKLDQVLQ